MPNASAHAFEIAADINKSAIDLPFAHVSRFFYRARRWFFRQQFQQTRPVYFPVRWRRLARAHRIDYLVNPGVGGRSGLIFFFPPVIEIHIAVQFHRIDAEPLGHDREKRMNQPHFGFALARRLSRPAHHGFQMRPDLRLFLFDLRRAGRGLAFVFRRFCPSFIGKNLTRIKHILVVFHELRALAYREPIGRKPQVRHQRFERRRSGKPCSQFRYGDIDIGAGHPSPLYLFRNIGHKPKGVFRAARLSP